MSSRIKNWRGDDILEKVRSRVKAAIDDTTAETAIDAKRSHPFVNRTGRLEASLRSEPAKDLGGKITGRVGSWDVGYAIYVELGPHARPYLRPSAERTFPRLKDRIGGII